MEILKGEKKKMMGTAIHTLSHPCLIVTSFWLVTPNVCVCLCMYMLAYWQSCLIHMASLGFINACSYMKQRVHWQAASIAGGC